MLSCPNTTDKLPRQTYTDATSSGMTRGHECDVAGIQNNDLVRTLFHLRSKALLLYFVLHSYFIHTRLFGIRCKSLYVEHVRFGDLVRRSCFIRRLISSPLFSAVIHMFLLCCIRICKAKTLLLYFVLHSKDSLL